MKYIIYLSLIVLSATSFTANAENNKKCPWEGIKPTKEQLNIILENHLKWLSKGTIDYKSPLYANLCKANLTGAELSGANLSKATLSGADLTKAKLNGTNLTNVNLNYASLTGATLWDTILTNTFVYQTNFTNASYEPISSSVPNLDSLLDNNTIFSVQYGKPRGVIAIREAFDKSGLNVQAKKITRLISERNKSLLIDPCYGQEFALCKSQFSLFNLVEWTFQVIFFEWPTNWGTEPGRALKILIFGIGFFLIFYLIALRAPDEHAGVWKVRPKERIVDEDLPNKELIQPTSIWHAFFIALYFSLLSAFHFGWRDLNVGSWISRIQRKEYTYRATGWVRTVAGIQSLLSVYLIAMWALTYFGRPFD